MHTIRPPVENNRAGDDISLTIAFSTKGVARKTKTENESSQVTLVTKRSVGYVVQVVPSIQV